MSVLDNIKSAMATSATGYAAVIDGALDIRTVTDTIKGAAYNAMVVRSGRMVMTNCTDPDCNCIVEILAETFPDVKLVSIRAEVVANG